MWSHLWSCLETIYCQKILCSKKFGQNFFKSEKFWVKKIGFQKILGLKNFWVKNIFGLKNLRPQKIGSKLGQQQLSYSWHGIKLSGQILFGQNRVISWDIPGQMSPGQILPEQMSMSPFQLKSVQDGPRNLSLKFGQNWVSNSWDIPYMDKCRKD